MFGMRGAVRGKGMANMDVKRIREDFPILGQQVHGHPLVYLDNSATTQVPEQVLSTVAEHYRTSNANVHRGMHYLAHASTDALEHARETVARFVGAADSSCVVFTRGTTDGLNMVARGLAHVLGPDDAVVVSLMEHHSNYVPWQQACFASGADFRVAGLTAEGDLDEAHYAELLADGKVKIVAMTGCSNVLGTVTPVKRLAKMAHDAGALFVLDGAQIMRHGVVDIVDLGVDYLAFSGHKMMAGTGIGALCSTRDALEMLAPRDFGGEMVGKVTQALTTWEELPLRLEAGTPNYVGAIALGAACDYLCALGREEIAAYESELVNHAASVLGEIEGLHIAGSPKERAGLVSFTIDGVHPLDLCTLIDARGVALRSGHNCAQPVLDWLGTSSVARLSPAFYNTTAEIDYAAQQIDRAAQMLRAARPRK